MCKIKHGHTGNNGKFMSPTYITWLAMKQRCYNKNYDAYYRYGGRGIKVCDRWKQNFKNFLEDMGERPDNRTLDRINNNKGYCKENCKWSTNKEQCNNTRANIRIKYKGEIKTLTELSRLYNVSTYMIKRKLKKGFSVEEAITKRTKVSDLNVPDISKLGKIRWLRKKDCTLQDIGNYFGVSRQRIQQILK